MADDGQAAEGDKKIVHTYPLVKVNQKRSLSIKIAKKKSARMVYLNVRHNKMNRKPKLPS